MNRPLKILMALPMPWTRDLGAPRVSVELADELERLGHTVDKFDIDDAFPKRTRLTAYFVQGLFGRRLACFVRQHGHEYDVIQTEQGMLPYSKRSLNFEGVLVVRSNGLYHFYEQYLQEVEWKRYGRRRTGKLPGRILQSLGRLTWGGIRSVERGFDVADLIILINQDEQRFVSEQLGHQGKCVCLTNGMSEERFAQFAASAASPQSRLSAQEVVYVGGWTRNKGKDDLPLIARQVRQALPQTRFLLMGTGGTGAEIISAFAEEDRAHVSVVPFFASPDLPRLLAHATVGVFPSYTEGFGIAVLEKLAAGVPAVTYDIPGPREMMKHFPEPMMVRRGNTSAMAEKLVQLLRLDLPEYERLSEHSQCVAGQFRWQNVAAMMLNAYQDKLAKLEARAGERA